MKRKILLIMLCCFAVILFSAALSGCASPNLTKVIEIVADAKSMEIKVSCEGVYQDATKPVFEIVYAYNKTDELISELLTKKNNNNHDLSFDDDILHETYSFDGVRYELADDDIVSITAVQTGKEIFKEDMLIGFISFNLFSLMYQFELIEKDNKYSIYAIDVISMANAIFGVSKSNVLIEDCKVLLTVDNKKSLPVEMEIECNFSDESRFRYSVKYISVNQTVDIKLPDNVKSIDPETYGLELKMLGSGEYGVSGYSGDFNKVTIPSSYAGIPVAGILGGAFLCADTVEEIRMSDNLKGLYNAEENRGTFANSIRKIYLSRGLTAIGSNVFWGYLGSVVFPIGSIIDNIESRAFCSYAGDSLTLPVSVKRIESEAFSDSTLDSIAIPNGVEYIGENAFRNSGLASITIPDSVKNIEDGAFSLCGSLESVNFTSGVKQLGDGVFSSSGIKRINSEEDGTVILPDFIKKIGSGIFSYCVEIIEAHLPVGLSEVPDNTFYGCTKLEMVMIPETVFRIGEGAFRECVSLEEITLPEKVAVIANSAFNGCTGLSEVDFVGENLISIDDFAFNNCSNIRSVTLPESLKELERYAFGNCTSLETIRIPSCVWFISSGAFAECPALSEITVSEDNRYYKATDDVLYDIVGKELICYPAGKTASEYILPETVEYIYSNAFSNASSLERLVLPASVNQIGYFAFDGADNLCELVIAAPTAPFAEELRLTNSELIIFVPETAVQNYKQKGYFSIFGNSIHPIEE